MRSSFAPWTGSIASSRAKPKSNAIPHSWFQELFMKSRISTVLALGLMAGFGGSVSPQGKGGDANAARNGWLSSLEEGKKQARESGKPLMVVIRCVP
jgi:hypothetical protein